MQYPTAMRHRSLRLLAAVLVLTGSTACKGEKKQGEYGGATTSTPPGAEMPGGGVTPGSTATTMTPGGAPLADGNIAAILTASNQEETQPSQLAVQRTQNSSVKQYAQQMITDHTRLQDSLTAMIRQQNITATQDPMSTQIQSQTQQIVQRLEPLKGADFDRAYMEAMVTTHQNALDALNSQLIPSAQNPQLKTALQQKVLPVVQEHLNRARQIQSSLR